MRGFVAELSDGVKLEEDTILQTLAHYVNRHNLHDERPWILLRRYLQDTGLTLVSLHLQYDHQGIFLPKHARTYFYSRKVEGYLGGTNARKEYIGVGATEARHDEVVITWFDGEGSKQETRKVNDESPQFITCK
jgi:hypothetical protein